MWVKESEKSGRRRDNAEGASGRLCVRVWACAREEEECGRAIGESLKWESKDRSAQIDIAITRKAIPQLQIHLHALELGCSPATVPLRSAHQHLIHMRKDRHQVVTMHTLTVKIPSMGIHFTGRGSMKTNSQKEKQTSVSKYGYIARKRNDTQAKTPAPPHWSNIYDVYCNSHISCNSRSVQCPEHKHGQSLHRWTHAAFGKRLTLGSNACHSEIQRTGCHAHFPWASK